MHSAHQSRSCIRALMYGLHGGAALSPDISVGHAVGSIKVRQRGPLSTSAGIIDIHNYVYLWRLSICPSKDALR